MMSWVCGLTVKNDSSAVLLWTALGHFDIPCQHQAHLFAMAQDVERFMFITY